MAKTTNGTPQKTECCIAVENVRLDVHIAVPNAEETTTKSTTHFHPYTELFACTAGQITILTDLAPVTLLAGDIALIPAGVPHYKKPFTPSCSWYVVSFSVTQHYTRGASDLWQHLKPLCSGHELRLFKNRTDMCSQVEQLCTRHAALGCRQALQLLMVLTELCDTMPQKAAKSPSGNAEAGAIDRAVALEQIFETHFAEDIHAEFVADMLHISPRQLTRIVRQQYGKSFRQVLNAKRLAGAAYLLKNTELPIEQVCYRVGYHNVSLFYRKFKERYGLSPNECRKQKKK